MASRTTASKKVVKRTKPAASTTPKSAADAMPVAVVEAVPPAVTAPAEKHKLVRDSFTMPRREYEQIAALKGRLLKLEHVIKKGELLRAGITTLTAMADDELLAAVERVQRLKTGRPEKAKNAVKGSHGKKS